MAVEKKEKSLFWTYFFWLFGGFLGLHHFYLGRDRHAFALWISFGGYFGLGVLRDGWRIPEYVADYNEDRQYMIRLVDNMKRHRKPPYGTIRFFASIIVADILGYLVMGAIPHELFNADSSSDNQWSRILISLLVPLACAIGVHIVGNIGRYSGQLKWPLLAAYATAPLYYMQYNAVFITSLAAVIVFVRYSLMWRRTPTPSKPCKRYLMLTLVTLIYCSLWLSWFYFNCSVTDKNEETIKCRVALSNFFNSPAWLEFRSVFDRLIEFIRIHGIWGLWNEIVEALDPQGEINALRILELTEKEATQEVITTRYRKLARQWHPDKHHNAEDKKTAEEKFMSIQQAYDLLSRMKQNRLKKQMS